jgi:hypothetical protein
LICRFGFDGIALQHISTGETEMGESTDGIQPNARKFDDFLELTRGLGAFMSCQLGIAAHVIGIQPARDSQSVGGRGLETLDGFQRVVASQRDLCRRVGSSLNWTIVSSGYRLLKSSAKACVRAASPIKATASAYPQAGIVLDAAGNICTVVFFVAPKGVENLLCPSVPSMTQLVDRSTNVFGRRRIWDRWSYLGGKSVMDAAANPIHLWRCKELSGTVNGPKVDPDLSSEGFADPVVGEGRVLDGRLHFRHMAGCTVLRAYGAGRAWVIVACFCAWLIDVTLQTA